MKLEDAEMPNDLKILNMLKVFSIIFFSGLIISAVIRLGFSWIYFSMVIPMLIVVIGLFYLLTDKMNFNYSELKNTEECITGSIIGCGYVDGKYERKFYIWVEYILPSKNKTRRKKICFLKENEAYKVLEELIENSTNDNSNKILIDLYINKNNIFADLENVDLTKVDGFKEAWEKVKLNEE